MVTNLKKIVLNPNEELVGYHLIQVQENVGYLFNQILRTEFQNGVFKEVTLLSAQDNFIDHGLDRACQGFIITRKNAQSDIWESSTNNIVKNKQIILKASANVTATLYLF